MNSKERILTTINHQEPDRVPLDSWMVPEVAKVIIEGLNLDIESDPFAMSKVLGNDLLYLALGFCDGFSSIFKEVRKVISILSPGGGHILCSNHTIQASERAVDNTVAYYWAAEKFRNYPLNVGKVTGQKKLDVYFT